MIANLCPSLNLDKNEKKLMICYGCLDNTDVITLIVVDMYRDECVLVSHLNFHLNYFHNLPLSRHQLPPLSSHQVGGRVLSIEIS